MEHVSHCQLLGCRKISGAIKSGYKSRAKDDLFCCAKLNHLITSSLTFLTSHPHTFSRVANVKHLLRRFIRGFFENEQERGGERQLRGILLDVIPQIKMSICIDLS